MSGYVISNGILPACLLNKTMLFVPAGRNLFFFYHTRTLNLVLFFPLVYRNGKAHADYSCAILESSVIDSGK